MPSASTNGTKPDGVYRYQEVAFVQSVFPYYLQSKQNNQEAQFLKAAHRLLFDRFPIMQKGVTLRAFRSATNRAKRVRSLVLFSR